MTGEGREGGRETGRALAGEERTPFQGTLFNYLHKFRECPLSHTCDIREVLIRGGTLATSRQNIHSLLELEAAWRRRGAHGGGGGFLRGQKPNLANIETPNSWNLPSFSFLIASAPSVPSHVARRPPFHFICAQLALATAAAQVRGIALTTSTTFFLDFSPPSPSWSSKSIPFVCKFGVFHNPHPAAVRTSYIW